MGERELTDVEELLRIAIVLSSKNRVMQRPESVKMRPTVAAAELERQKRECEEEDDRRK